MEAASIKVTASEICFFIVTLLYDLKVSYHFAAANDHGLMIDDEVWCRNSDKFGFRPLFLVLLTKAVSAIIRSLVGPFYLSRFHENNFSLSRKYYKLIVNKEPSK